MPKVTPFLWFDAQVEEVANFYMSVFKNGKILEELRYNEDENLPGGRVTTATIELEGMRFIAFNGGPYFSFTEAFSFSVDCETQEEVDYYWERLTADGGQESMCGWLKDKYGLSWQIVPRRLMEFLADEDEAKVTRVRDVMLQMHKLDISALEEAYRGN